MEQKVVNFLRELLEYRTDLDNYMRNLYGRSRLKNHYDLDEINYILDILEMEGLVECVWYIVRFPHESEGVRVLYVKNITIEGKYYFDNDKRPRIAELIDRLDLIERTLKEDYKYQNRRSEIRERRFRNWFYEIRLELRNFYERSSDVFVKEILSDLNSTTDEKLLNAFRLNKREVKTFYIIKSKLIALRRNLDKYSFNDGLTEIIDKKEKVTTMTEKKHRIFISHSSKDIVFVKHLVDLLDGMGLDQTQVFCSSLPGYGIPINMNIFDYLRNQFIEYDLHVIFIHSENYYKSPICLNEMGAAWAFKNSYTSILLPGFDYSQMIGVVNNQSISIKLDGPQLEIQDKLNQLYDSIISEFGLNKKTDIIWQQKRDAFINNCLVYSMST